MTLFAGSRNLGVDISSFMGDKQPFDQMGQQAVYEDAQNVGLSFGLGAELNTATVGAGQLIGSAGAQAEAIESAADSQSQAMVANAGMGAGKQLLGGILSGFTGGGGGAVSSSPYAAPAQTAFNSYFKGLG